jgi:hypothetical protein
LRHFRCGQIGGGGQDELAVQPGVSLFGGFIDADAALGHLEKPGMAMGAVPERDPIINANRAYN